MRTKEDIKYYIKWLIKDIKDDTTLYKNKVSEKKERLKELKEELKEIVEFKIQDLRLGYLYNVYGVKPYTDGKLPVCYKIDKDSFWYHGRRNFKDLKKQNYIYYNEQKYETNKI